MTPFLDAPSPRWFTIPAHRPFLDDLAEGVWKTLSPLGPDALADATILLPTRRAARFLAQMELANLAATGTFDGSLPLVFDQNGGRIEGGMLVSRPPGGSLSYVGALTYKDLSPMANFAFDALKSLDYRAMQIGMDGALEGEIVTRVRFDGVKQGSGAKRNFLTRRLARLPLQFNVNLRAPFYGLINSVKAMYDPAYIKDPRSLGLIDAQGRPVKRPAIPGPQPIQPPVSENKP